MSIILVKLMIKIINLTDVLTNMICPEQLK